MSYSPAFSREAERIYARLDRSTQRRIGVRVRELAEDPYAPRLSKPLTAKGGLRRSRVGGWRIIFSVNPAERVICIVTIEVRGQVYRRL